MLEKICPKCGSPAEVADNLAESSLKCSRCGNAWTPGEEAEFSRIPTNAQLGAEIHDSGNPYQPPAYEHEGEQDAKEEVFAEGFVHTRIGTGELLEKTWNLIAKRFDRILLALLILAAITLPFFLVLVAISLGLSYMLEQDIIEPWLFFSIMRCCDAIEYIIGIYLIAGSIQFWLNLARGGKGEFKHLFPGVRVFGLTLAVCAIQILIYAVVSLIIFSPFSVTTGYLIATSSDLMRIQYFMYDLTSYDLILLGCCSLVSMIAITIISVRIGWAEVFVIDGKTGILNSIRYASRFSRGNFISILLNRIICTMAVMVLGMLTCCLGSISIANFLFAGVSVMTYFGTTGQRVQEVRPESAEKMPNLNQ